MTRAARLRAITRFILTSADANRLAAFYVDAFGCRRHASARLAGPDFERLMGVQGGALRVTLTLGERFIELLQFDQPGCSYPSAESASDLDFQHFALVVGDMTSAYQHLARISGWSPISRDGPVELPPSSGGVTAFKFRDPEGHPLELLAFPASHRPPQWDIHSSALCLGIDHSAIGVRDTAASVAFYESLGFSVTARSLNVGSEQQRLDDVEEARVEVTGLQLPQPTPHLELLCYRQAASVRAARPEANDVAATRLVFEAASSASAASLVDPDGHRLVIVPASDRGSSVPTGASRTAC